LLKGEKVVSLFSLPDAEGDLQRRIRERGSGRRPVWRESSGLSFAPEGGFPEGREACSREGPPERRRGALGTREQIVGRERLAGSGPETTAGLRAPKACRGEEERVS